MAHDFFDKFQNVFKPLVRVQNGNNQNKVGGQSSIMARYSAEKSNPKETIEDANEKEEKKEIAKLHDDLI